MENQHREITGYRELDSGEIDMMNAIKEEGERISQLVERLRETNAVDQRWVSIGQTDLQKGVMALVRSVAKPTSF